MKYLTPIIITVNILGLVLVQLLETWRPGSVAGLLGLGWIFSWTVVTTVASLILRAKH